MFGTGWTPTADELSNGFMRIHVDVRVDVHVRAHEDVWRVHLAPQQRGEVVGVRDHELWRSVGPPRRANELVVRHAESKAPSCPRTASSACLSHRSIRATIEHNAPALSRALPMASPGTMWPCGAIYSGGAERGPAMSCRCTRSKPLAPTVMRVLILEGHSLRARGDSTGTSSASACV
jgi:hypothetical protein